jgi:hypothetical protein
MTQIYCVKCRSKTSTNNEKDEIIETASGERRRLIGICKICNTKKCVFAPNDGSLPRNKSTKELALTRQKRQEASQKRKALKLGMEIINNNAQKCVKKCLTEIEE